MQGILHELLESPAKLRSSPTLQMTGGVILGEGSPLLHPVPISPVGMRTRSSQSVVRTKWAKQQEGPGRKQVPWTSGRVSSRIRGASGLQTASRF